MELLHWLQDIRIPVLNEFFLLITHLGEETAFLVIALIVFWCVDKRQGYYILSIGFIGTVLNQFLKLSFHIARPWVKDPTLQPVAGSVAEATGFSFPSGHTQSSVTTLGGIGLMNRQKWLRITMAVLCVLVPFSRLYLGVHTPADVGVSLVIAIVLLFAVRPVFTTEKNTPFYILMGIMIAMAVGLCAYVHLWEFPQEVQGDNLIHGTESAYTLLGAVLGLPVVYFMDQKILHFSTKAPWYLQIAKVALGLALVLVVKTGLKAPLNLLFGELPGRAVRYFLTVLTAGCLCPWIFGFITRGKKCSY